MASLERATTQPMERWVVSAPLHRPDFEVITARLGDAVQPAALQTATSNPAPRHQPLPVSREGGALTQHAEKNAPPGTAVRPAGARHYFLQFGAFTHKRNAEKLLKELTARYRDGLRLSVAEKDALYKVVTSQHPDKKTILKLIQTHGITDYFITSE
jgi:cell division septation protein DedD